MRVRAEIRKAVALLRGYGRTRRWGVRLGPGVHLSGPGTYDLRPGCVIRADVRLYVARGATLTVMPKASVGDRSIINVVERVVIGEGTEISWDCQILDSDFHTVKRLDGTASRPTSPVRLGSRVLVGTGSIITKGVEIGDESVVGAGSVVTATRSFPPRMVIAGNPATVRAEISGWIS